MKDEKVIEVEDEAMGVKEDVMRAEEVVAVV